MVFGGAARQATARLPAGGRVTPSPGTRGYRCLPLGERRPGAGRTGTERAPLAGGRRPRMGITVCNVPAAPLASLFTLVMTQITNRAYREYIL